MVAYRHFLKYFNVIWSRYFSKGSWTGLHPCFMFHRISHDLSKTKSAVCRTASVVRTGPGLPSALLSTFQASADLSLTLVAIERTSSDKAYWLLRCKQNHECTLHFVDFRPTFSPIMSSYNATTSRLCRARANRRCIYLSRYCKGKLKRSEN